MQAPAVRRHLCWWIAAAFLGLLGVVTSLNAGSAHASTSSACADETGVTVVVDFGRLGGVRTACAAWPVTSGLDALEKAGFDWTPVAIQPGFVCRIDGLPADDACQVTPPADRYWGYWHAIRGGAWTYSARGADSYQPASGGVEGWAFGDSERPGVPPPPPYEPPPTSAPPTSPAEPPVTSEPPQHSPTGAPSTLTAPPSTTAEGSATTTPSASLSATDVPQAGTPRESATDNVADDAGGGGSAGTASGSSPLGVILGGGVILALAASGFIVARRRRLHVNEP